MIPLSEALGLVIDQARSFGKESLSLDEAGGRVIAEPIVADRDYPPFNRAAMDGYAIRLADWTSGLRSFSVREVIFAGNVSKFTLEKGECYKIMTGAAVPFSANLVIRKEDVVEHPGYIECSLSEVREYQHISKRGEDLKKSDSLFSRPLICSPAVTGLLASVGKHQILVEKLPLISIITTGDEVTNVNETVSPVQIRNSNSHVLKALLKKWHIVPSSSVHVRDDLQAIEAAVKYGMPGDIIILCGGVSAGDADHVPAILQKLGAKNIFHRVAIKPGQPLWFGKFDSGPIVFALPGNPLSCMVTCKVFIDCYLSHSFGLGEPLKLSLPLNGTRAKKSQLDEFFPVKISGSPSEYEIIPFNGSGDITAATQASALAMHPALLNQLFHGTTVSAYPLW